MDTRIGKVRSGEYDAVVLARAGLARIGRLDEVTEVLDPLQMLPAPGQGALAVECRADDAELVADLAALDDAHARAAVEAERAVLATLEGGCSAPIGALAEVVEGEDGDEMWVRAVALSLDGALAVRSPRPATPADAVGVGVRLANEMLADGAAGLGSDTAPDSRNHQTRGRTHDARQDHHRPPAPPDARAPQPGLGVVRRQRPGRPRACSRCAPSTCSGRPTSSSPRRPSTRTWCARLLGLPEPVVTEDGEEAPVRARARRRRLRRGRPAADPRGPRQGRRQARQARARAWSA